MAFLRRIGVPLIGVAALLLGGCGGDGVDDGDEALVLANARHFESYRVYYAGTEVAGQPLEPLGTGVGPDSRATSWFFIYGHCDADDFPAGEGGCQPPLQIHNYSVCERRPDLADARRRLEIRGVPVAESPEGGLELTTGATTITIGATERTLALAAVRGLRAVREARPGPLPAAIPGSLQGTLPCRHIPN
jgi:hypothetical protein